MAIRLMTGSILGAIAYFIVRTLLTDLCDPVKTGTWSGLELTLYCTIFPVAVILVVVLLVFSFIGYVQNKG